MQNAEETEAFGLALAKRLKAGDISAMTGNLGAGKTTLTKSIAAGLGIEEMVNSPTFTIVQEYRGGRLPLYHFDVYRIGDMEEMEEIGFEDYLCGEGVCLIEWGDMIRDILPKTYQEIHIEKNLEKGFDYRRITIERIEP